MGIPLLQQVRVGAYVVKQRLMGGVERYLRVLMLEPPCSPWTARR